jgi:putative membrane protein
VIAGVPLAASVYALPAVNAALNGSSAVLLAAGYLFIRRGRVRAHHWCMLGAFAFSALFLAGYLWFHFHAGIVRYQGTGWHRVLYFSILIPHTILAAVIVPLALITLTHAFRERFDRHRRIARWTLPAWLFVSVTGVVVYFMLFG